MSSDSPTKTQLAVIGAGPGGYAAAFLAADLGLDVALVDDAANPGGVCLYRGCIPSKALLHVAKVISESREAARWGVEFGAPKLDLARLREWKEGVVAKLTGGLGQLARQRKVRFLRGRARLLDPHRLRVESGEAAGQELAFEHAILATGSRPAVLPGLSLESPRVMDSTAALELRDVPSRLLVVGGGYIGLELGTVYGALGSRVTVVEAMPTLLPGVDADLVGPLARRLAGTCEAVHVGSKVLEMKEEKLGLRVRFAGGAPDGTTSLFDKVLVAVGRRPNSAIPGLETTRVRLDDRGFIRVDAQRRTDEPSLFAIGDVAGEPMLAHKASHEGRVAAEATAGRKVAFEPRAIPAVVFTDPEIAWCGMTESEAKARQVPYKVARFPWAASGRALTLDRPEGLTKLLIDPQSERLLGAGIVGSGAGELISEAALAVEMAALATDLRLTIHPHPTLSETLMESAEVIFGQATHVYRPARRG